MEIRRLTDRDAEAYRKLRLEGLEREPTAFTDSVAEHQSLTPDAIKDRLSSGSDSNWILGAFIDGHLIGMAGFHRRTSDKVRHRGEIRSVYVSAEHRGKSVGHALLRELIRLVETLSDIEQIALAVSSHNSPAKRLYASLGFEVYGCEKRAIKVGDQYIDEELMVLYLER